MTRLTRLLAATAIVPCALLVGAAKPGPAPAPAPFVPAVVFYYGGNTEDLRLANADGSAAVLLHRSAGQIRYFDPAPHAVAYIEQIGTSHRLMLRTWTQDVASGAITVAPPRLLLESDGLIDVDFSADGSRVAVENWTGSGNDYSLTIVDTATGAATVAAVAIAPLAVRWSAPGDALYYKTFNSVPGQTYTSGYTAYRQPISGEPRQELFTKGNIERWDISRDGSDSLILNYSSPETGSAIPFAVWDGSSLNQVYANLKGYDPLYSCQNARLFYHSVSKNGSSGPFHVYTPSSGSDVIYSRDSNVKRVDWIPCG